MYKIINITKVIVYGFIIFSLINFSFYLYALITPKFTLNTKNNIEFYDNNDSILFNDVLGKRWIELENIDKKIITSTILSEDKNFYNHKGFDFFRIFKALVSNVISGSIKQGASTISQQYVKNLFLDFDQKWSRKIEEAMLTVELEAHYSKKQILEGYLNTINYGNGIYGIQNAAYYYFNKSAENLTWEETTMLVGIPKNPTSYNPRTNYENSKKRQKEILKILAENGIITKKEEKSIFENRIALNVQEENSSKYNILYYKDAVIQELNEIQNISKSLTTNNGLKIYTNIDENVQNQIQSIVDEEMIEEKDLQVGLLAVEPSSGKIIALIGGTDYNKSQFNRATNAYRQVGSTMKSFLYYGALENGFTASSTFISEPTTFNLGNNKTYTPHNYGNRYATGPITLAQAAVLSDNIYAIKTHLFLGTDVLKDVLIKSGLKKEIEDNVSLPLGTVELSLIEYSNLYNTLANLGKNNEPYFIRKITDMDDNILYEHKQKETSCLDSRYVYILNEILSNSYNYNYIGYNTPTMLGINSLLTKKYSIKSGSTDSDLLTIGYNPDILLLVWNGYDDNSQVSTKYSTTNKRIWAKSIEKILEKKEYSWYDIQDDITSVYVNIPTGQIENNNNNSLLYYIKNTEPTFK